MKKFCIKKRINPQFDKPYYVALGQITKKEIKAIEKPLYATVSVIQLDTREEYLGKIDELKLAGATFINH
jgi:hypothetical protein